MPFDSKLLLPGQDRVRGELGAVVADDHARAAAGLDDAVEFNRKTEIAVFLARLAQRLIRACGPAPVAIRAEDDS